jgi:hypothetical protein
LARGFRITTEMAFILGGLLIIVMTWGANLLAAVEAPTEPNVGHSVTGNLYLWLMLMFNGLAFATVGVVYENYERLIKDRVFATRYLVGFLFIADGALHLLAFNEHIVESFLSAAFFGIFAPIQIAAGIAMPSLGHRLDPAWLLLTAFFLAAYAVTRTVAVWPVGIVEAIDPLGVLSKLVELLTIGFLISLVRAEKAEARERMGPAAPMDR